MNKFPPAHRESLGGAERGNDMVRLIELGVNSVRMLQNGLFFGQFWGSFGLFALENQFVFGTRKMLSPFVSIDSPVRSVKKHLFSVFCRFSPFAKSISRPSSAPESKRSRSPQR
jgi:hypothetical protein